MNPLSGILKLKVPFATHLSRPPNRKKCYGKFRRCVFQSPAVARFHRSSSRVGDLPVHGNLPDGLGRAALEPSVVQRWRHTRIELAGRGARIELAVTAERHPASIVRGMNT